MALVLVRKKLVKQAFFDKQTNIGYNTRRKGGRFMKYELTWEDTKRLMHTAKAQMPIASSCLNNLLKHKRNGEIVQEKIDSFQQGQFSCFKDMPEELKEIQTSISFIQEEGGVKLELDPNVWMISVFFKVLKYVPDCKEKMHQTSHLFYIEGKEEYLKKIKEELINTKNLINDLIAGKKGLMCQTVDKEELKHIRKIVLWLYRNIDQVFEAYQKDLPKEILEEIDQEKLLLYLAYISYTASGLLEAEKEEEIKVEPLAYIQNYLLYVNYQKSLDPNYRPSYHDAISERSELATLSSFQRQMDNTYEACPDLLNKVDGYQTIDDLLKEVLKDLRNRIRKEQFKKDIELSWEFIPEPLKESSYHTNNHYFRKNKTEEEKDVLEQKKKEILEAKLDVFKDLPYIATLKGIDHFEGYIAYLFPNGKVIMEKFYKKVRVKKGKYALEPAINEAIYVMGIENFQTLSRQGKMEIRRYINETNDPHAKVIYHFKNFKQKVLNEITGCDYSSEVLDYVDQLIQSEKSQVYQKCEKK